MGSVSKDYRLFVEKASGENSIRPSMSRITSSVAWFRASFVDTTLEGIGFGARKSG